MPVEAAFEENWYQYFELLVRHQLILYNYRDKQKTLIQAICLVVSPLSCDVLDYCASCHFGKRKRIARKYIH